MLWDDGIHFPNFLAPALEHLIIDFDTENPKKRGALVSGKFKIGTRHSVFKGKGGRIYQRKLIHLCGNRHFILSSPSYGKSLESVVEINPRLSAGGVNEAVVRFELYGEIHEKKIRAPGEFFTYRVMKEPFLNKCSGIELRPLGVKKNIKILGENYYAKKRRGRFMILVFNRGAHYAYNFFNEKIALLPSEAERKSSNFDLLLDESRNFAKSSFLSQAENYLISKWQERPEVFEGQGAGLILEGKWPRTLDSYGNLRFRHPITDNSEERIYVNKDYARQKINAYFLGNYVFLYYGDLPLNAHKTQDFGFEFRSFSTRPKSMEYLRLRNINPDAQDSVFLLLERKYKFHIDNIVNIAGFYPRNNPCAILAHNAGRGLKDDFKLLVKTKNGEVMKREISPDFQGRFLY